MPEFWVASRRKDLSVTNEHERQIHNSPDKLRAYS